MDIIPKELGKSKFVSVDKAFSIFKTQPSWSSMRTRVRALALLSGLGSRIAMSCGVGCRCSSDLELLWCRLAATAPIGRLAWEPPYAAGAALKTQKGKKKKSSLLSLLNGIRMATFLHMTSSPTTHILADAGHTQKHIQDMFSQNMV